MTWKFLRKLSFLSSMLLFFAIPAQATLPDSLGLSWGLGLSEFRQMDFDIEEEWPLWSRATAIRLGERSKKVTDAGSLILVFDREFGLVKTHWAGKVIERDELGTRGMDSFERLKKTLSQQYGTPDSTDEELSVKLQGFHGSFYQCLKEQTCGQWKSIWDTPQGGVLILELVGLDPGIGFLQMTHQGPNLENSLEHAHQGLNSQEHEI